MRLSTKWWVFLLMVVAVLTVQYRLSSFVSQNSSPDVESLDNFMERLGDEATTSGIDERVLRDLTARLIRQLQVECRRLSHPSESTPIGLLLPFIFIITPTYRRPEQLAELTRLSQTLMHVPNVHWLVIEDAVHVNPLVASLLKRSGVRYEHLSAPMPAAYREKKGPKPRGVSNRNLGLQWVRKNAKSGVVYFADDDNTYDIRLFEEIRTTKRVSMWPVGLCTKYGISSPLVRNGSFDGFYDGWMGGRKFAVDMAGFAVSVEFLLQRPKAMMPYKAGYEEDGFLKSMTPFEPQEIELKADNCTKILVWHTQAKKNEPAIDVDMKKYGNTNIVILRKQIV